MGLSLLESLRKLIRQDTVKVGGAVGNMHGAVQTNLGEGDAATQSWLVLTIPGKNIPTLAQFFDAFSENPSAMRLEFAEGGVVVVNSRPSTVSLLRTVLTVERALSFNMDVVVASTGSVAAVYVDGTLVRTVKGQSAVPIALSAGRHTLYVLVSAPTVMVTVPKRLSLIGETDVPRAPQWVSVTTGYLDALSGTAANVLRWLSDSEVGNYRVLRREPVMIGDLEVEGDGEVLEVTQMGANETFDIALRGDHFGILELNAVLLVGGDAVGVVASAVVVPGEDDAPATTVITCRLPFGVDGPPTSVVGHILSFGTFTEVARVTRVANTSVIEYKDAAVTTGNAYEYALQATGLVDDSILSPLSEVRYVVTGDIYPPGPITFLDGYPKVSRRTVTAKFLTPPELDYAGVNVYYRKRVVNPLPVGEEPYHLVSVVGAVVTADNNEFPTDPEDNLTDFLFEFIVPEYEQYTFRIVSNTASTITLNDAVPAELLAVLAAQLTPVGLSIYKETEVKTDYGRANRLDELSFDADNYGMFVFATFDRSGNEQGFNDAVKWTYTAVDDTFFAGQPVLAFRQLLGTEQEQFLLPIDYTDTRKYAIIEVWAFDPSLPPANQFDGVTIFYQRVGLDVDPVVLTPIPDPTIPFPYLVTDPAQAVLDDPEGTRSRFVLIDREYEQVRMWAENAQGFTTDITTFFVDLDDTPEVTVEVYYNYLNNTVSFVVVADDDTRGFTWKVDQGPESIVDARTIKRFDDRTMGTIPLNLGEKKTLTVTPYGKYLPGPPPAVEGIGEQVVKELVRTPRSYVTFDSKDANGARSATFVTASFAQVPAPVRVFPALGVNRTGSVSLGGAGFVFTDGGAGWTTNQYQASSTSYAYLVLRPTSNQLRKPVIRRIASNTETTLSIPNPLGDYVGIGEIPYEIVDGAVMLRKVLGGSQEGLFLPTVGKEVYERTGEFELEFFATKNNSYPESIRRVFVDDDALPRLIDFRYVLVEENDDTFLDVGFGAVDDDATTWEAYEKKNAWPTMDGQVPSSTSPTQQANLDRAYLRFSGTVDQTFYRRNASGMSDGDIWYAVGVPKNSFGQPGIASTATHVVGGAAGNALTSLTLTPNIGQTTVSVGYIANAGTPPSTNVSFLSTRADNPNTAVTATRQVSQSPYPLSVGETIVSAGGVARTWTVSASLVGGNTLTRSVSFLVGEPSGAGVTISANATIADPGSCDPEGCVSGATRPHTRQVSWSVFVSGVPVTDPGAPYLVDLYVTRSATISGSSYWEPLVFNMHATDFNYMDETLCQYSDPEVAGSLAHWHYKLVVKTSEGTPLGVETICTRVDDTLTTCAVAGGDPGDPLFPL